MLMRGACFVLVMCLGLGVCAGQALAIEKRVFFTNSEEDNPPLLSFPRDVRRTTPLTDVLRALFEGPTAAERAQGAEPLLYGCAEERWPTARFRDCTYDEVIEAVRIRNGQVQIEVKGYPNGAASGIWEAFDRPLAATIRQFPNLKSWIFTMNGYRINGGEWGCGNMLCFRLSKTPPSDPNIEDTLATYGVERLPD